MGSACSLPEWSGLCLGLEHGQTVEREPYDLVFGQRKAPDGTPLSRPPDGGRKIADVYARLLAAEPHATADRKRELRIEAAKQAHRLWESRCGRSRRAKIRIGSGQPSSWSPSGPSRSSPVSSVTCASSIQQAR